ncbi:MAG: AraC family transcriptional regulator [Halarcobacter sp.]
MKKNTLEKHTKLANNIMYYIYKYIDTDINLDELCIELDVSRFHMHRIFKEEFGQNIYETIKSIRLQKASLLLLTNKNSTITDIAKMCGYGSQAAFMRVFKQKFEMTPKQWRKGEYKKFTNDILIKSESASNALVDFSNLMPSILKMSPMKAYYIRHKGYGKSIRNTWQKLHTWLLCNNIENYTQLGLHHDNPTITPLDECRYNACIVVDDELKNETLPSFIIPGGVYARFDFEGKYGDILKFMHWVYFEWLINSGYETTTNPSYAIYKKNHFLDSDEKFIVSYYIPIRL